MAKFDDHVWQRIMADIVEDYAAGDIIAHGQLKKIFLITEPEFEDFEDQEGFIDAVNLLQFEYMTLVEKLRLDILKKYKLYLRNIRGDGYTFLKADEQTDYAKDNALDGVRKELRRGILIMQNIRHDQLSADQRRKNSDEMAKLGQLQHMMKVFK